MKKILVGVDGTEASKKTSHIAADFINPESEVTLITVITEAVKEENIKERINKVMDKEASYFKDRGIEVKKEIHYGHPAEIICNFAAENNFDLIILADKKDQEKRFLLGGTSDKVVRHAETAVMVVK
jgi:nucleotide-binding universal stress UspA family protein